MDEMKYDDLGKYVSPDDVVVWADGVPLVGSNAVGANPVVDNMSNIKTVVWGEPAEVQRAESQAWQAAAAGRSGWGDETKALFAGSAAIVGSIAVGVGLSKSGLFDPTPEEKKRNYENLKKQKERELEIVLENYK